MPDEWLLHRASFGCVIKNGWRVFPAAQLSETNKAKGAKLNLGKFDLSASSGVGHTDMNMETGDLRFSFKSCEGRRRTDPSIYGYGRANGSTDKRVRLGYGLHSGKFAGFPIVPLLPEPTIC